MSTNVVPHDISCSFCGKHRSELVHLIEGPTNEGTTIYICSECIDASHAVIHHVDKNEENVDLPVAKVVKPHTPDEIKKHMDEHIIGQDAAKEAIAVAIYNHHKRLALGKSGDVVDKSNLLLIGSSGSGKTLAVKTVASLFELPYVIADATSVTESGYAGGDVVDIIAGLVDNANGDIELAQTGIIFIDEIDKKSKKSDVFSETRDISGEGVQQALLKIIEGTVVEVENDLGAYTFDTTNVLFIFSGSFVGLDAVMKRGTRTNMGIGATLGANTPFADVVKTVSAPDLIKYGLIPEFVGRCPVVIVFEDMTHAMLVRILTEPKNSIVNQFKRLFKYDGVALEFEGEYLTSVADKCVTQKTGARGLRAIIERDLQATQFNLPKLAKEHVKTIVVGIGGIQHISVPIRVTTKTRKHSQKH